MAAGGGKCHEGFVALGLLPVLLGGGNILYSESSRVSPSLNTRRLFMQRRSVGRRPRPLSDVYNANGVTGSHRKVPFWYRIEPSNILQGATRCPSRERGGACPTCSLCRASPVRLPRGRSLSSFPKCDRSSARRPVFSPCPGLVNRLTDCSMQGSADERVGGCFGSLIPRKSGSPPRLLSEARSHLRPRSALGSGRLLAATLEGPLPLTRCLTSCQVKDPMSKRGILWKQGYYIVPMSFLAPGAISEHLSITPCPSL